LHHDHHDHHVSPSRLAQFLQSPSPIVFPNHYSFSKNYREIDNDGESILDENTQQNHNVTDVCNSNYSQAKNDFKDNNIFNNNKYNTNFGSATPNDNFNVYNSIIRTPKTPVFPQTPKTTVFKNFIHVFEDSNDNYLLSLPSLPLSLQENYDVPHAVKNSKLIILNVL